MHNRRSTSLLPLMAALALETGLTTGLSPSRLGGNLFTPLPYERPRLKKSHRPSPPGTWKPHPSRGPGNQHTPSGYPLTKRRRKTSRLRTKDFLSEGPIPRPNRRINKMIFVHP